MKHPDDKPLLKEILADDQLAALRRSSLGQGLAVRRRARGRRRGLRVGMLALLPVLLSVVLTWSSRPARKTPSPRLTPGSHLTSRPAQPPPASGVKMISDEELFSLFPGRSLALIGKPGQQQLVFLDDQAAR